MAQLRGGEIVRYAELAVRNGRAGVEAFRDSTGAIAYAG